MNQETQHEEAASTNEVDATGAEAAGKPAKPAKAKKEKKEAAPKPEKIPAIVQNGISRPKADTATGKVWEIADAESAKKGGPAARKEVLDAASQVGINAATAATQYGRWRKFHGLSAEKAAA